MCSTGVLSDKCSQNRYLLSFDRKILENSLKRPISIVGNEMHYITSTIIVNKLCFVILVSYLVCLFSFGHVIIIDKADRHLIECLHTSPVLKAS